MNSAPAISVRRPGFAVSMDTVGWGAAAFLLLHVPLAFALQTVPVLGAALAAGVLFYGIAAALRGASLRVLYTLGYIAGAEVLWRMTHAPLPWEFGKYASVLVVCVALAAEMLARARPRRYVGSRGLRGREGVSTEGASAGNRSVSMLPLAYFLLLLPAVAPTLLKLGLRGAVQVLSFNLSGPLALAVLALYLWRRPVSSAVVGRISLAIMAPVLGILTLAAYSTFTSEVDFGLHSNFTTSGGFGPNQVSNLLSFGALAAVVLIVVGSSPRWLRIMAGVLAGGFVAQGLLTFSRGGVVSLVLAVVVLGLHVLQAPGARGRFLALMAIVILVGAFVVVPMADDYTKGALGQRYSETDTTGRTGLTQEELRAFGENPVTGTGVGLAASYRKEALGREEPAHTEATRVLAEHGMLGALSLLILVVMGFTGYRSAGTPVARGLVAAFGVWAVSVMLQSAMRFVAISLAFGFVTLLWDMGKEPLRPEARS